MGQAYKSDSEESASDAAERLMMKHFYIITNELKDPDGKYRRQISSYLKEHGRDVTVRIGTRTPVNGRPGTDPDEIPEGTDCLIVLGGDGTLLQAARDTVSREIPLIGINLGNIGYLAEVETSDMDHAMDCLLMDECQTEERMMLFGMITAGDKVIEDHALNDVVITRSGNIQIMRYNIYVNGHLLNAFLADGIIVATATGSTGYNLSAGGPIVEPAAKTLVLTPICSPMLHARSIILSPDDEITIEIAEGRSADAVQTVEASFDGNSIIMLHTGDRVLVRRSSRTTRIIKLTQENFLNTLRKKMGDV